MTLTKFLDLNGLRQVTEKIRLRLDCKQDKLTGLPGQVVGFGAEGVATVTFHAGNNVEVKQSGSDLTISAAANHRNLLDNWYFLDPINQRGQTEYTGAVYTIDRWNTWGNIKVVLSDGGLLLSMPNGEGHFRQFLERDAGWFQGKQFTLSALTSEGLYHVSFTAPTTKYIRTKEDVIINLFTPETGYSYVRIFNSDKKVVQDCNIKAVKLELGSAQTLARQDAEGKWVLKDAPPNKAMELLKCQRYYQVFTSQELRPVKAADFRPVMRANPALGTLVLDGETYYTADANL